MCQGISCNSNEGSCCHKLQKTLRYLVPSGFKQRKYLVYTDFCKNNINIRVKVWQFMDNLKIRKKLWRSQEHTWFHSNVDCIAWCIAAFTVISLIIQIWMWVFLTHSFSNLGFYFLASVGFFPEWIPKMNLNSQFTALKLVAFKCLEYHYFENMSWSLWYLCVCIPVLIYAYVGVVGSLEGQIAADGLLVI